MVKHGLLNSRMKDFFDLWQLAQRFDFNGSVLAKAVRKTFSNRQTLIVPSPVAFSPDFSQDSIKAAQWRAFMRKIRMAHIPEDFDTVIAAVASFLGPIAQCLADNNSFRSRWKAPGPWQE